MQCPECSVDVTAEQRFCNKCGTSLASVTGAAAAGRGDGPRSRDDGVESAGPHTQDMMAIAPEWSAAAGTDMRDEPTGSIDTADLPATQPSPVASGTAVAATTPVEVDEPEAPQLYDFIADEDTDERAVWEAEAATSVQTTVAGAPPLGGPNSMATRQMPAAVAHDAALPAPSSRRFRFSATLLAATATAIVGIVAITANIVTITSDARIQPGDPVSAFRVGDWQVADLATNLAGAIVIATVGLFVGGLGTCFGMRWASGLVGGSGLGGAGMAALAIGMAERPIHAAKLFVATPTTEQFTITITRDAGYWLLFTFAVLGVLLFFLTVNLAGSDRRPALNPWLAAVGALAAVIAACGPLLPVGEASFDQNWVRTGTWADEPAAFSRAGCCSSPLSRSPAWSASYKSDAGVSEWSSAGPCR